MGFPLVLLPVSPVGRDDVYDEARTFIINIIIPRLGSTVTRPVETVNEASVSNADAISESFNAKDAY